MCLSSLWKPYVLVLAVRSASHTGSASIQGAGLVRVGRFLFRLASHHVALLNMKFFAVGIVLAITHATQALWPLPKSYQTGSSTLTLAPEFNIEITFDAPNDLHDAVHHAHDQIKSDKHQRLVVDRGAADSKNFSGAKRLIKLFLNAAPGYASRSIAEEAVLELGSRDEAYTLKIPADGGFANLSASSALGLFRGLSTFTQLWYTYDNTIYTNETPISIQDSPAYVCLPFSCGEEFLLKAVTSNSLTVDSCLTQLATSKQSS